MFQNPLLHLLLYTVGMRKARTQTTEAERAMLARFATGRRKLLEIGVFEGVTTRVLRQHMAEDGELFAIDPFFKNRIGFCNYEFVARREVASSKRGRVTWVKDRSVEALKTLQREGVRQIEFAFIDGDHSYQGIKADWEGLLPLLSEGAIVCLHDSRNTNGHGSEQFTKDCIRNHPDFKVCDEIGTLTIVRKVTEK